MSAVRGAGDRADGVGHLLPAGAGVSRCSRWWRRWSVYHSRFGTGLFAIHDDEDVAEVMGVPTFRYKLGAFALSCGAGRAWWAACMRCSSRT